MSKKHVIIQTIIFLVGGLGYLGIEMLYRAGHTHWLMGIIGGLCLVGIVDLNYLLRKRNIIIRTFSSAFLVTLIELFSGLFINKLLNMNLWDYSYLNYNFCGQICLQFSMYWLWLCFGVVVLFDISRLLRRKILQFKNK